MSILENRSTNTGASSTHKNLDTHFIFVVVLVAFLYAGLNTWIEQMNRIYPLDIDGWGHLTYQLKNSEYSFSALFHGSFLKKGPIVPFIFGLWYYIAPYDESILILNTIAFALSAGCLFIGFRYLGASQISSTLAIFLWLFYLLTHRYVFGYYYIEPLISLLNSSLFLLVGHAVLSTKLSRVLIGGAIAGLLVLARAPYLFVVLSIPIILWFNLSHKRKQVLALYSLGLLIVYVPWPLRNVVIYGEFIPFTTEGSMVLFQGTYLKGDSSVINDLRKIPQFVEIEEMIRGKSELDQYHTWKRLAREQFWQDPLNQLYLSARKALRFWIYLPPHSWMPSWKTAAVAALSLPLACIGFVGGRRQPLMQLCAVWVVGLWLFHAIVHAELRYNFPVLPMMFMMALYGAQSLGLRLLPGHLWDRSHAAVQS